MYKIIYCEYEPKNKLKNCIYIIGLKYLFKLVMHCPKKGCNHLIQIPLIESNHKKWKIFKNTDGSITLDHSIQFKTGCKVHFDIINSRIIFK